VYANSARPNVDLIITFPPSFLHPTLAQIEKPLFYPPPETALYIPPYMQQSGGFSVTVPTSHEDIPMTSSTQDTYKDEDIWMGPGEAQVRSKI